MYNSYEEYMQSVLGLNVPNTYMQNDGSNYYGEPRVENTNLTEINKLYPEIYRIVYPMVQKACSIRSIGLINEAQINDIVDEIYNAIEPREGERGSDLSNEPLKNGDVKNPRVKETRRPSNNFLLRDLIRILVIRELLQGGSAWQIGIPRRPGQIGGTPPRPQMPRMMY